MLNYNTHFCFDLLSKEKATNGDAAYFQVCEILEENALMSKTSNGEPWLIASQLRDHLLLPKERKDTVLWKKVLFNFFESNYTYLIIN